MDFSKRLVRAVPRQRLSGLGGVFRFPKPFPPYSGIPPPEFHRPELEVHFRSPENVLLPPPNAAAESEIIGFDNFMFIKYRSFAQNCLAIHFTFL